MTYRELLEELKKLSDTQLDMSITYWDDQLDEYYAADIIAVEDSDRIETTDAPHPVFVTEGSHPDLHSPKNFRRRINKTRVK